MPELPEVETVCRGIRPHLLGRTLTNIRYSGKNLRQPVPVTDIHTLALNSVIISVERRAKYLLIRFENGNVLIVHLGMTGNLGIFSPDNPPSKHCHIRFDMNTGMELRYTDIRRFGSVHVFSAEEVPTLEQTFFHTTGPEPFSEQFTAKYLYTASRSRSIPVKAFIMQNQIVAGVGNIYANESLFLAGIHPLTRANKLSKPKWEKLVHAIRQVLEYAIECGGSTISDYVNADQESGYFQINFNTYGRDGEECKVCGSIIMKEVIGGRASFFCSTCQKKG